jgi:hypothetical protein
MKRIIKKHEVLNLVEKSLKNGSLIEKQTLFNDIIKLINRHIDINSNDKNEFINIIEVDDSYFDNELELK